VDPTCSIGKGGGSPLVELSIITHSAPEWSQRWGTVVLLDT